MQAGYCESIALQADGCARWRTALASGHGLLDKYSNFDV